MSGGIKKYCNKKKSIYDLIFFKYFLLDAQTICVSLGIAEHRLNSDFFFSKAQNKEKKHKYEKIRP